MSLECVICLEKYSFLKYLSCQHSFCVKCLKQLKKCSAEDGEIILCPLDRLKTVLKSGTSENSLQANFMLVCEDCSEENLVSKCWWCCTCEDSICKSVN